jgi:hypothetical protein
MNANISSGGNVPYFDCPSLGDNTQKTLSAGAAQSWSISADGPYQLHSATALSYYCIGGTATVAGGTPLPSGTIITRYLRKGDTLSVISATGTDFDVTKEPSNV